MVSLLMPNMYVVMHMHWLTLLKFVGRSAELMYRPYRDFLRIKYSICSYQAVIGWEDIARIYGNFSWFRSPEWWQNEPVCCWVNMIRYWKLIPRGMDDLSPNIQWNCIYINLFWKLSSLCLLLLNSSRGSNSLNSFTNETSFAELILEVPHSSFFVIMYSFDVITFDYRWWCPTVLWVKYCACVYCKIVTLVEFSVDKLVYNTKTFAHCKWNCCKTIIFHTLLNLSVIILLTILS